MKRRSKAGGGKQNNVGRQTAKPNRQKTSHGAASPTSSVSGEADIARLTRELHQALEQQAATSDVLGVISSTPGELERVFQLMLMTLAGRYPVIGRELLKVTGSELRRLPMRTVRSAKTKLKSRLCKPHSRVR